jgi:hypothetical protein
MEKKTIDYLKRIRSTKSLMLVETTKHKIATIVKTDDYLVVKNIDKTFDVIRGQNLLESELKDGQRLFILTLCPLASEKDFYNHVKRFPHDLESKELYDRLVKAHRRQLDDMVSFYEGNSEAQKTMENSSFQVIFTHAFNIFDCLISTTPIDEYLEKHQHRVKQLNVVLAN